MKYILLYIATLIVFFLIDLVWLGVISKSLYKNEIGHLMADQAKIIPALVFYLLYVIALLILAVIPGLKESTFIKTLLFSSLLGFISYGTYDLTNFATLKDWPVMIVFIDMAWGTFLTASVGSLSYVVGILLKINV